MEMYLWLVAALLTLEIVIFPLIHVKTSTDMTRNKMVTVGVSLIAFAGLIVLVLGYGQGHPYEIAHSNLVYAILTVAMFNVVMPYALLGCEVITDPELKR